MYYELDDVFYQKKNDKYEIILCEARYNRNKKKYVLVITGTREYVDNIDGATQYTRAELEELIVDRYIDDMFSEKGETI